MPSSHSVRWLVFFVCGALAALGCSTDTQQGEYGGSLALELTIAGGIEINVVAWEISGGEMEPMSGLINTSAPGSTASVEVFGIPPGENYLIEMMAIATDEETTCKGDAFFDIEVDEVTKVHVMLNCKRPARFGGVRVDGRFNICAELTKVVVSPLQTSIGNDIDLASEAVDADDDEIEYLWTGTGGSIADPTAASTTYTCQEDGDQSITIRVSDDDFMHCVSEWTVPVHCVGDLECEDKEDCDAGEICLNNECRSDPDLVCDEGLCAEDPAVKAECVEKFLLCLEENPIEEDECIIVARLICNDTGAGGTTGSGGIGGFGGIGGTGGVGGSGACEPTEEVCDGLDNDCDDEVDEDDVCVSPNPECEGSVCSAFAACNLPNTCIASICATNIEGGGVCVEGNTPCEGTPDCTTSADCGPGGQCLKDTCCGRNICATPANFCLDEQ